MMEKMPIPSSPPRAEAPANDAPTFPLIKAEAFDEEGHIFEAESAGCAEEAFPHHSSSHSFGSQAVIRGGAFRPYEAGSCSGRPSRNHASRAMDGNDGEGANFLLPTKG